MKSINTIIIIVVFPLLVSFTVMHKYYISVTQINYIQDKQSVQITSRIFIDDFENVLKENYDQTIELATPNETEKVNDYVENYLKENIVVKINNKASKMTFIGKEYEGDIMRCYLEIEGITRIESFEVFNSVLFDMFEDQQNIVKTKMNSKQKSFILTTKNAKAVLNFN